MARFNDERAPLGMGSGTNKQKIVGCPECKMARYVSKSWFSGICSCGNYFNSNNCLAEADCEGYINQNVPIDKGFTAVKADAEKKAYKWKDEQIEKRKRGDVRTHEPPGTVKNW